MAKRKQVTQDAIAQIPCNKIDEPLNMAGALNSLCEVSSSLRIAANVVLREAGANEAVPPPAVPFNGGYVQATKSVKGNNWRVTAWRERRLPSGNVYHTRAATRMRRSEEAARKAAGEMAAFWSKDNPDFAEAQS